MGGLSVQQQNIKALMELGLTLQESRIYCSLIEIGPSKVENIAKISKTSRSDVYRTIKKLMDIGDKEHLSIFEEVNKENWTNDPVIMLKYNQ